MWQKNHTKIGDLRSCLIGSDGTRPSSEEWYAQAPFIETEFAPPQRSGSLEKVRIVSRLVVGAIVRSKKDRGLFIDSQFSQAGDNLPDPRVESADHGRLPLVLRGPILVGIAAQLGDFRAIARELAGLGIGMWDCGREKQKEWPLFILLNPLERFLR